MKLSKIIEVIGPVQVKNFSDVEINGLAYDSRDVKDKTLFFAIEGERLDGHKFILDAIQMGANSCVIEKEVNVPKIPLIKVNNSRESLAEISSHFYGYPSQELTVIGVTGTNGKTTTSFLIRHIIKSAGKKTGLIGTIGCFIGDKKIDIPNTTPESLWLQRIMREMVDSGVEFCIMEVSSHGIKVRRIKNIDFDIGILTNISRDHLDFHKTLQDYLNTKIKFFSDLKKEGIAIINLDDKNSRRFLTETPSRCLTYGIKKDADVKGEIKRVDANGIELLIKYKNEVFRISSLLRGRYNAYNILPSFAVAHLLGLKEEEIKKGISSFSSVCGRGELIKTDLGFNCVIDYAHTPDALFNLFSAERELIKGKLICVFGAGGDRDKGKRPMMGRVAGSICDVVILTSDNPRNEEPESIIKEVLLGLDSKKVTVEMDRRRAIENAIEMAKEGDTVIIAGKGHEKYQEVKGEYIPFNDKEVAEFFIKKRKERRE